MTIQERVNEQATKKRRTEARAVTATGLGWVDVDEKKEAFLMPMRAVEHQWGSIIMPNRRHRKRYYQEKKNGCTVHLAFGIRL